MPELPEVETIRRGLAELLPNRQIKNVDHNFAKSFPNAEADVKQFLIGASITKVKRRAKVLIIELDSGYCLLVHLKMTGQLVFKSGRASFAAGHPGPSLIGLLPDRSTRVIINFKDNSRLFFNDQRKFGWMRLLPLAALKQLDFFKKVGPEPLSSHFTWPELKTRLMKRANSSIKAALLDQSVIAGVGNIYADESLWGAKIHPATLVRQLKDTQIKELYKALRFILKLAIKKGGSSDKNYLNAKGEPGSYLSFARVFRRNGQACRRCGHEIIKIRVAGRGTHLCPFCQKLPK